MCRRLTLRSATGTAQRASPYHAVRCASHYLIRVCSTETIGSAYMERHETYL